MVDTLTGGAHPPPVLCEACASEFHGLCTGFCRSRDPAPLCACECEAATRVRDFTQQVEVAYAGRDQQPADQPNATSTSGWSPARWAYGFYSIAATGAVVGQVWVAITHVPWPPGWPMWARVGAVLPFALCLELLGMATAAMADQRQQLGERAYGFRVLSAATAVTAVGVILVGHWPHVYQVAGFGALSGSAYVLWLLHSAARRRDALRELGLLAATAPTYGWRRRLRHPVLTARAAELARERGLGLYASLRQAELDRRAEARRPAIAAAVEQVVRADHADPRMAEIAATTLDLDRIAAELESQADYAGWADRLAPAVLAHRAPTGHSDSPASGTPEPQPAITSGTGPGVPDRASAAGAGMARAARPVRPTPVRSGTSGGWGRARAEREYRASLTAGQPLSPAELARQAGRDPKTAWRWIREWTPDATPDNSGPAPNGHR